MYIDVETEFPSWERVPDNTMRSGNYRTKDEIKEITELSMDDTMAMLRGSLKPSSPLQLENVMESFVRPLLLYKMKRYEDVTE
jgi:hypothetical protein